MSQNTLLLGTRKGLITYKKNNSGKWIYGDTHFLGIPVTIATIDVNTGYWWALLDHGHWGCKVHRSKDGKTLPLPDFKRPFRDVSFEAAGHDGGLRYFAVSGLPRFSDKEENFTGAIGIAKDVTNLVRVERANVQLADAIEVLSG